MASTLAPDDPDAVVVEALPRARDAVVSYDIEPAPVAVGGQGSVHRALTPEGVLVAVKVAAPGRLAAEALACEATLLRDLRAQGVESLGTLRDQIEVEGRQALVLDWIEHGVDEWVQARCGAAPARAIEAVIDVAVELCRALAAVHACELADPRAAGKVGRVIHRDLKPGNVRVRADGTLVLIDLGGSVVVDKVEAVRMAVFGSPMWAPYDQVLPGEPEPSATWDTYAALVMLFHWLTGERPVFQADPSPMLTARGRELWAQLAEVARTDPTDRSALVAAHRRLSAMREGTRESDLVDVKGHGAIQAQDLDALAAGVRALAAGGEYGVPALGAAAVELGRIMARGLSPLSHPSPPNRYWSAAELADELAAVRGRLVDARRGQGMQAESLGLGRRVAQLEARARLRRQVAATAIAGLALLGLVVVAVVGATVVGRGESTGTPLNFERSDPRLRDVVMVAAGPFVAGDVVGDGNSDERPTRVMDLPAFALDRHAVSVEAWLACMDDKVCGAPVWKGESGVPADYVGLVGPEQPVVGITFEQARSFCAWRGGRLPTEWEWEKAATWSPTATQAADKRPWPWGAQVPDCQRANWADCANNGSLTVDALPAGASAYGAIGMVGNVWEWTDSTWSARKGLFKRQVEGGQVLRGGSWQSSVESARPTFRRHVAPSEASPIHGFRCAYAP
jgi:formylglycine-generating enzyme required for sulfatase activity/serine/threonine protein kinase